MPLNDIPGAPVWQAALCNRIDVTALAIALNLGMARYMEAVNAAFDIAPMVEREP